MRTNALVVAWLLAAAVVAVAHRWVPAAGWLMTHLLLLGAASTAVLIWTAHFAQALGRRPLPGGTRHQSVRLALHTAGATAVLVGLAGARPVLVAAGAALVAGTALWHAAALLPAAGGLGTRLGWTTRYFVASALALPVGALLGWRLADATGPFGEGSGHNDPIAVENFHMLAQRQTTDTVADPATRKARVNLLNWDGKGTPPGLFPPRQDAGGDGPRLRPPEDPDDGVVQPRPAGGMPGGPTGAGPEGDPA